MAIAPLFIAAAAPSRPSQTLREAASSATMVTTASASIAASFGEAAQCAPRAIKACAFALLRLNTATLKPASR